MTYIKIMLTLLVIATAALAIAMFRGDAPPATAPPAPIDAILDMPVESLALNSASVDEAITALSRNTGVRIVVDWPSLQKAGISRDTHWFGGSTVEASLDNVRQFYGDKKDSLNYHVNDDGTLSISADPDVAQRTQIYDVHDLLTDEYWGLKSDGDKAQANEERRLSSLANFLAVRVRIDTGNFAPMDAPLSNGTIHCLAGKLIVVDTPSSQRQIERLLQWLRRMR